MGFSINFHGSVGTVYNIEVAAGAIVHIGGGSNHSSGKFNGDTCPIKISKAQRTEWGTACTVDHQAPEGWTSETFTSERAFSNDTIPAGLNKGDTIFYWKKGVSEKDVPDGFIAVYGADNIIVIVPASSGVEVGDGDDNTDSSLDGGNDDFDDFQLPTSNFNIVNSDSSDPLDVNDNNDENYKSPF